MQKTFSLLRDSHIELLLLGLQDTGVTVTPNLSQKSQGKQARTEYKKMQKACNVISRGIINFKFPGVYKNATRLSKALTDHFML